MRSSTIIVLLILFGWNAPASAGGKDARTDALGDPLPAGAVARLGTTRLQHKGKVTALAFSPDGTWLASAGGDATIRFWDVQTGKAGPTLAGHKSGVRALAFVPAEKGKSVVLISASYDKTIRFWDVENQKELPHVVNHSGTPTALAVSPDGKLLYSASAEASHLFVWKIADAFIARQHEKHGLKPQAEAPREILVRRLYLDLVGVPPGADDLRRIEQDRDDG